MKEKTTLELTQSETGCQAPTARVAQGRFDPEGPETGGGEPVGEVELAGVECFLVAERTRSTPRAEDGMGQRIGAWGRKS